MFGYIFFAFWRVFQIVTLIPTLGMLAYFVHGYQKANQLTPSSILVLFIVSVLAAAWAPLTLFRHKSTRNSAIFVSFVDLCFMGAFIAGVVELGWIAKTSCTNFSSSGQAYLSIGPDGVSGSTGLSLDINKTCAMLKASFAFGIMNTIFFFITSGILLLMHRSRDDKVKVKESYRSSSSRRRSHDSRRGHSRSGSNRHRSSRDSRRNYYV